MGNQMVVVAFLAAGAALLYFMGCRLGISAICSLKGEPSPSSSTYTAPPTVPTDLLPAPVMAGLAPDAGGAYPRVTLTEAMEYIANQCVTDIDKYTYRDLGRNTLFNMKAELLEHYKSWLTKIAEYNDVRLQPLQGRALAKYSELILELARRFDIVLNPGFEAAVRANLFAGSPTQGNLTANMAFVIA